MSANFVTCVVHVDPFLSELLGRGREREGALQDASDPDRQFGCPQIAYGCGKFALHCYGQTG